VKVYDPAAFAHKNKISRPQQTQSQETAGGSGTVSKETDRKRPGENRQRKDGGVGEMAGERDGQRLPPTTRGAETIRRDSERQPEEREPETGWLEVSRSSASDSTGTAVGANVT